MAVEVYGVVSASLDAEFSDFPAFSASTNPSSTEITTRITTVAGQLNNQFRGAGITPATIAADDEAKEMASRAVVIGVASWVASVLRISQARKDDLTEQWREIRNQIVDQVQSVLGSVYEAESGQGSTRTHSPDQWATAKKWTSYYAPSPATRAHKTRLF